MRYAVQLTKIKSQPQSNRGVDIGNNLSLGKNSLAFLCINNNIRRRSAERIILKLYGELPAVHQELFVTFSTVRRV